MKEASKTKVPQALESPNVVSSGVFWNQLLWKAQRSQVPYPLPSISAGLLVTPSLANALHQSPHPYSRLCK